MELPAAIDKAWTTLSAALSPDKALAELNPTESQNQEICRAADEAARGLSPILQSGIYLYVDDLDRAHSIVQVWETPEAAYWHGIMHRREGDYPNAKYWFRRAGVLPKSLGLDPIALTDQVASRGRKDDVSQLVEGQRAEWMALFEHCAKVM